MGDCPKCGYANPGAVDFCPNPECRTYLGWATEAAPPQPAGQRPPTDPPPLAAIPPPPPPGPPTVQQPTAQQRPAAPPAGPPQKRDVRVTIEPTELTVDPGGEVTTKVTVRNLGTRVEEFQLTPQGTAAPFASITPDTVSIYPDVEQRAVVRFAPPRGPQSPAGIATFEIVARSAIHTDVSDVARGRLTITPFTDLNAVLTPDISRGRTPARHQVSVTNGGNTPVSTQVAFKDQDGELTFEPRDGAAALEPGATMDLPVLINGPRHWFGRTARLPFSAVVTPTGTQPPITLNGTRQQTPVFPWWIPTAAVAIMALVIGLYAAWPAAKVPVIPRVDQAAAVQQLKDAGYQPDPVLKGDDNVPKGLAIETDPAGGTALKRGERVKLNVSNGKCPDGPCPVEVPNVEGLPVTEALAKLEDKKFTVRTIKEPSDERAVDRVISSEPKATTPRPSGSEVVLKVSSGPKTSPQSQGGPAVPVPLPLPGGQGAASPSPSPAPSPSTAASPSTAPSPSPSSSSTALPSQPELPDLTARSVADATKALMDLGLKAKTEKEKEHSNAVPDGQVLSTTPAAGSKVDPGSEVTLTVARNTRVDLIDAAAQAAWKSEAGKLTFPGNEADQGGFALIGDPVREDDGTTTKVLATHPRDNGFITGVYKLEKPLAEPAVPGDHVHARVGLVKPKGAGDGVTPSGTVTFVVKANGKEIKSVTTGAGLKDLDADLSSAEGATSIEITTVLAAQSSIQDWVPVWQNLRLEPR